jgi:hypothetical protein
MMGGDAYTNTSQQNVLSDYNLQQILEQKRSKARLKELQRHVDNNIIVSAPLGSASGTK